MSRKLWLSVVMVAVGASLLVVAGFARPSSAASGKTSAAGGTLNYDLQSDIDYSDPALSYYVPSWEIEYATCLKLLNYPDANGPKSSQLQPEAATGFPKVSNGGRTYDFNVKASFTKFNTGEAVTPANFQHAIERLADPKMQSPATPFINDIVGVEARLAGKASSVSGVKVKGSHLIITLTKAAPDFLSRIAMPFFCAVPKNLPVDPNGVNTLAAAGPYYYAARTPNKSITVKRNPNYHGKRPHNADQINYTVGNDLPATQLRLENGQADLGGVPPSAYAGLAKKYVVNKGRFFVKPNLGIWYVAMNHDRPLFKTGGANGNVPLKKAVNYALDRHAMVIQRGAFSGVRTDQILPPGMQGFKKASIYPTVKQPNFAFAKKLASGHTGDGKAVLYTFNSSYGPLWAQIVQFDMKQIGLDVEVKQFARAVQFEKEGTRGEPFDMTLEGWSADYPDPFDFINVLLSGDSLHASNNNNVAYFNSPVYNKKMEAAARTSGAARYTTYGNLDVDIMKNAAPWAPILNPNNRYFVSGHVGCFTYNNVYGLDLAAMCKK
ncbi:MAG TPA: ABC transporter substrate-binding protein [Gaiellaceae bacterium]|nr:ABC transporter substrate-binding protein [Gaiellaceae bacterium]